MVPEDVAAGGGEGRAAIGQEGGSRKDRLRVEIDHGPLKMVTSRTGGAGNHEDDGVAADVEAKWGQHFPPLNT